MFSSSVCMALNLPIPGTYHEAARLRRPFGGLCNASVTRRELACCLKRTPRTLLPCMMSKRDSPASTLQTESETSGSSMTRRQQALVGRQTRASKTWTLEGKRIRPATFERSTVAIFVSRANQTKKRSQVFERQDTIDERRTRCDGAPERSPWVLTCRLVHIAKSDFVYASLPAQDCALGDVPSSNFMGSVRSSHPTENIYER